MAAAAAATAPDHGGPAPGTTSGAAGMACVIPAAPGWSASSQPSLRPGGWLRSQGRGTSELAAVDGNGCPGDERRLIRTQPGGGGRDFFGLAEAVQRQAAADPRPGRIVGPGEVVGEDRPGGDRVDPDSLCPVVE